MNKLPFFLLSYIFKSSGLWYGWIASRYATSRKSHKMWMNDRPLMVRHSFLYRSLNHLPVGHVLS
jgi:hypothetical protein